MITAYFRISTRAHKRYLGFRAALQQMRVPCDESLVIQKDYTVMEGREGASRLIAMSDPPTAIVCGNDLLAMGAMAVAKEAGLTVGKDLSITGFDDLEMSSTLNPPLTTVRIPACQMGRKAAELLVDTIEKRTSANSLQWRGENRRKIRPKVVVSGNLSQRKRAHRTVSFFTMTV
jgi:LacI family transcriptional regulator